MAVYGILLAGNLHHTPEKTQLTSIFRKATIWIAVMMRPILLETEVWS
jgi:hypothetical protein